MNIIQAVNDCLRLEMRRDSRVVVLGEDVGKFGGVFRATTGLQEEFGADRCIDTPLAEAGIIGTAIGMALYGLQAGARDPVRRLHLPGLRPDRERAGEVPLPLGRRVPGADGDPHAGRRRHPRRALPLAVARGAVHPHARASRSSAPSNPIDAKGLLASSIRGDDPVIFMEPKRVYRASRGDVPTGEYTLPLGEAKVLREAAGRGPRSVTLIAWSAMVHTALEAAEKGAAQGFDIEVIDLRTLMPFDIETIIDVGEEDRARGGRPRGAAHLRLRRRDRRHASRSGRCCTSRRRSCA